MSVFEVKDHNGAPTLFMDGEPAFPTIYLTMYNFPSAYRRREAEWEGWQPWKEDRYFEAFRDAGFHFYSVFATAQFDEAYDPTTGEFPQEAFTRLDNLRRCVEVDPEAKFLIRLWTEPRGEGPRLGGSWWSRDSGWIPQHVDECEVLEPKAKGVYLTPSFASKVWLRDACKFVRALIRYLHEHDLNQYVLGYLVAAGDSEEWGKLGHLCDWAGDYSRPMQEAFREWLHEKYGDVETLRRAWGDREVSFEQDLVPSPDMQRGGDLFLFKDPRKSQRAIDYYQCMAHVQANDINTLCGAVKEACNRESLAGAFYGYLQSIVWNEAFFGRGGIASGSARTGAAFSGHCGLGEVLACPDVDFLCSPASYEFRGIGGEGGFMSLTGSVRLAGKLWLSEEDFATHLCPDGGGAGQPRNTRETVAIFRRQMANQIVHAAGGWWCDWCNNTGGAYDEPEIMQTFRRFQEIGRHDLSLPDRSSAAEVAVVVDAEDWFYRSTLSNFDMPNWRQRVWGITRMGAPVDYLLLSDLLEGRAGDYKLYFFRNACHFSAVDRGKIKSLLRRDGKVSVWVYGPGFVEEDLSVEHCRDLTGINLAVTEREWGAHILISNFEHPITRNLPTSTFWGTDTRLGPLFTVDDPAAVTLGTVVTVGGRCEPGFVIREHEDWASVYSSAPALPPGVLREIARYANVHIYSDSEDIMYADHNYVALHTVREEMKTIRLPHRADVWEVYSDRQVGSDCSEFTDRMEAGTTHLYYYGPAPRP